MLGALFVARFLWPEFSHASPSRLQTESADRYFELSPAPLCAEGVCHGGRVRVGTEMAGRAGYHGRRSRSSRSGTSSATVPAAVPPRRGAPPASVGLVTRLAHPVVAGTVPRRARYASRVTQRPSYHVVRGDGLYSSQRRINYNINDVRRVSDVYCGDARAARACSFRTRLSLSLNLSRTLQCGFAFSRSESGTSRQRPSALPSGLVLA